MMLVGSFFLLLQILPSFSYQTFEIADGVYSFASDGSYFSMFIVTGDGVMVIEPIRTEHSKQMLEAIQNITSEPIKYLFYSHNHWDHVSGGQVFKDVGATIIANEDAYDWLKANPNPNVVLPDETWTGKKYIRLGNVTLVLQYFGQNHGVGNTFFLLPDAKVAYIADNVSPGRVGFTIMPDFNIKHWERTLEEYLEVDFEKAVFSQNYKPEAINVGGKNDVEDVLQFIKDLRAGIFAEFAKGTGYQKLYRPC
jgi:glyoxylase-like metal-dependent hydrolase (beta-lactamase superfamily II)